MKSTKKGSQKSNREKRSRPVQKKRAATNNLSQLEHRVETLERLLTEAQSRENATSEILRVIASSGKDLQRVLDTVAENAARLCEAKDTLIFRIDGDISH